MILYNSQLPFAGFGFELKRLKKVLTFWIEDEFEWKLDWVYILVVLFIMPHLASLEATRNFFRNAWGTATDT